MEENQFKSVYEKQSKGKVDRKKRLIAKRIVNNDPASLHFSGPWSRFEGEKELEDIRDGNIEEN